MSALRRGQHGSSNGVVAIATPTNQMRTLPRAAKTSSSSLCRSWLLRRPSPNAKRFPHHCRRRRRILTTTRGASSIKKIVATGRKFFLTTDDLTSFTTHNTNLPLTTPKKKTNFVDPAVIRGISVFVRGGTGREPYSRRSALRTGGSQTFQIPSWPRPRPRPRYG